MLHDEAIRLRHNHLAHTDGNPNRVRLHIQSVERGKDITYSVQRSIGGFRLVQFQALLQMVNKVRQQIEMEQSAIDQELLRARVAAGYSKSFTLGKEDVKEIS